MAVSPNPERALAIAVIHRAVCELQSKSPKVRAEAKADVLAGGLDFWMDILCWDYDIGDGVRRGLRELLSVA